MLRGRRESLSLGGYPGDPPGDKGDTEDGKGRDNVPRGGLTEIYIPRCMG